MLEDKTLIDLEAEEAFKKIDETLFAKSADRVPWVNFMWLSDKRPEQLLKSSYPNLFEDKFIKMNKRLLFASLQKVYLS